MLNEVFEISLNGSCCTWNGEQWCDRNFVRPPETIILELNKVLEPQLLGESLLDLSAWKLTEEAMIARDSKLYKYALKCLHRALESDPDNKYAINVLASMNRKDFGKSGEAIKTTDAASPSKRLDVGVTRAAALVDEGRYEEALTIIQRCLAAGNNPAAFQVYNRIKKNAPQLFS